MYKYYFTKNLDNEITYYFNESILDPKKVDGAIFDCEREERHYHMDLFDIEKMKYKYKYDGKKIVKKTSQELELTEDEKEIKRREWCANEIRKLYTINAEFRLIILGITDIQNAQYIKYRSNVEKIKSDSYTALGLTEP